jgi:hypothetical protein
MAQDLTKDVADTSARSPERVNQAISAQLWAESITAKPPSGGHSATRDVANNGFLDLSANPYTGHETNWNNQGPTYNKDALIDGLLSTRVENLNAGKAYIKLDSCGGELAKTTVEQVPGQKAIVNYEGPNEVPKDQTVTFANENGYKEVSRHKVVDPKTGQWVDDKVTATSYDGAVIEQTKDMKHMTITSVNGEKTVLEKDDHGMKGKRYDQNGNEIASVTFWNDQLFVKDSKTGAVTVEKADITRPDFNPKVTDTNNNTGITTTIDSATNEVKYNTVAPGRTDVLSPNGDLVRTDSNGSTGVIHADGSASVMHSDGSGARLTKDGQITFWSPGHSSRTESLTPAEQKYIDSHPSLDKRDLADVHTRLNGDPAKLESFYNSLNKIESSTHITQQEKSDIEKMIMRHVADPAEISQGVAGTCYATVIQRDLAMTSPEKYASLIADAVVNSEVRLADGTSAKLDMENMKMQDTSSRDLASRICQTAISKVAFEHTSPPPGSPKAIVDDWSSGTYANTPDGMGVLHGKDNKDETYPGINIYQVAATEKALGINAEVQIYHTPEELAAGYEHHGKQPMIASVNNTVAPFVPEQSSAPRGNHFVTITDVEKSDSGIQVYAQNQAGLAENHSGDESAFNGKTFATNVVINGSPTIAVVAHTSG